MNIRSTAGVVAGALIVLAVGFFALTSHVPREKQEGNGLVTDIKNLMFEVDSHAVTLTNGVSEVPILEGSASTVVTRYFGNEARGDLDLDGDEDVAFLVTQEGGGSGVFFYVVAAIFEDGGYQGSKALFIGDRIAPQTTEFQDGRVIVNYADRLPGEPMTEAPTLGKSLILTYDAASNKF
jgi:hypothetical protein